MPLSEEPRISYPAGLLNWAGHRSGGVRKPFRDDSGRPTGSRITTPLVTKLQTWATELLAHSKRVPRTVLLVGGPGNGKTDAIETCIEFIDSELRAKGVLVRAFSAQFNVTAGELPPRKVVVDLMGLGLALPDHLNHSITLIQDATEGDPLSGATAEQLLLEELSDRLDPNTPGLYLCCVNRGILAHAANLAQETVRADDASKLLNRITEAVTSGPISPKCWPLADFEHFAVWPMDVESLVDSSVSNEGQTVAHQIFAAALDGLKWTVTCKSGARCPFCQNRKILLRKGTLDGLVKLLRYYELASGKRWTFRDLFSLVPYLLVGDYSELEIKGRQVSPCDWASHQNQLARSNSSNDAAKFRAPYLLVSRLYHHRLFPRWPGLDRGLNRKAKEILKGGSFTPNLQIASEFFNNLVHCGRESGDSSGEILVRIRESLGNLLDPALAPGESVLFSRSGEEFTVEHVELAFSSSTTDGLALVSSQVEPLERDLLAQIGQADDALVEENFPLMKAHHIKILQSSLRQFSARLVKRSIGTQSAICRDVNFFKSYEHAINDPKALLEVRKQLKNLLHDEKNQFRASLVTTFGQPIAQRSRDIVLLTPSVSVREFNPLDNAERPKEPLPYLRVGRHIVPLTFPLFKALREVVAGLHDASLPAEIFALLNGIKSLVSGQLVRNTESLEEESSIEIGNSGLSVEIRGEDFIVFEKEI